MKTLPKTPRLMVAVLYWHGDQKVAESVAKLACDLLDEPTEDAELMFVTRYDSPPPSAAIQFIATQKFAKVHSWRCDRKALGFPGGCNEMAYGFLNYILIQRHLHGNFKNIDFLLILEADVVLTRKNWVPELQAEWLKAQEDDKWIAGALQAECTWEGGRIAEHINAVALYDAEIVRKLPCLQGGPNQTGWDHYHGPSIVPVAMDSKLFRLDYKRPTIDAATLFSGPLIYHGVKDDSAMKLVKAKFDLK